MRTRIIDLFRSAYRTAQFSLNHNIPIAEAEGVLQAQLSRRKVLQTGLLAAGVLSQPTLLKPRGTVTPTPRSSTDTPVLIVGAGIAGLTAAYRLRQAGVPVDIIEAADRVGGRLKSVTHHPDCPSTVELGGEFIDTRHTYVRALAAELGLELADLKAADEGLEPEILYFQGQKLNHAAVAEAFAPIAVQIARDLKAIGDRPLSYRNPNPVLNKIDRQSLAEYLEAADADPTIEQLLRVAYITEYGRDVEEQTPLNMLFLIGTEVGKWSAYGVSDERWHVVGGNDQIPRRLAEKLSDRIETGTRLESIRATANGNYRVSLRNGGTSRDRTYEHVLLAIPFTLLRQVELAVEMSPVKRQAIQELGYGTGTKLAVPFQERLWRTRYDSTISLYTDLDVQNAWESARYSSGPAAWVTDLRGGIAGLRLGRSDAQTQAADLAESLNPIFPGLKNVQRGQALRAFWAAEPLALGSYSCYLPGQFSRFGGAEAERVGNLWFAGEHCSVGSQGYMNGACESAEVAVRGILQDLNVTGV